MSHARQQIREAVGTLLSAAMVSYRHVFNSRLPRARDVLPYALVYTPSENSTKITIHPPAIIQRDIDLVTQLFVRLTNDTATHEETMDAAAAEVETKLTQAIVSTALGGKVKLFALQSTDSEIITEDENSRTYATISLGWLVQVNTVEGSPETLI